jgi:hypothetical protein
MCFYTLMNPVRSRFTIKVDKEPRQFCALNPLWSEAPQRTEAQQKPRSRLLEIIRVYGSPDMLPSDDDAIEDLAWNDFSHGLPGRGAKEPAWSFAAFLKGLEAPANQTVLLLGSYHSEE